MRCADVFVVYLCDVRVRVLVWLLLWACAVTLLAHRLAKTTLAPYCALESVERSAFTNAFIAAPLITMPGHALSSYARKNKPHEQNHQECEGDARAYHRQLCERDHQVHLYIFVAGSEQQQQNAQRLGVLRTHHISTRMSKKQHF